MLGNYMTHPMHPIRDSQETPIRTIGTCEGCGCCIEHGEDYKVFNGDLIHDDEFCAKEYLDERSEHKVAEA